MQFTENLKKKLRKTYDKLKKKLIMYAKLGKEYKVT